MPRVGEPRSPARPTTDRQHERQRAILRAAARLGSERPLDQVQMSDLAAQAGVSLGTLYRYYPSKYHLFAQLLESQIAQAAERDPVPAPTTDPATAVADMVAGAVRATLTRRRLAQAMITSTNVVRTEGGARGDVRFRQRILRAAGITEPTDDDHRLARLVEQCAYGVLTWAVAGELAPDEAEADLRRACSLLLDPWVSRAPSRSARPARPSGGRRGPGSAG